MLRAVLESAVEVYAAFNSLFEMHNTRFQLRWHADGAFNSLFEMLDGGVASVSGGKDSTFNSLFEMRGQEIQQVNINDLETLSILYLRCIKTHLPHFLPKYFLSILYLRCRTSRSTIPLRSRCPFNSLFEMPVYIPEGCRRNLSAPFNSLFEMP